MVLKVIIDTVVEIKHICLSCICCVSLNLFVLLPCIRKETAWSDVASIQGQLLFLFINSYGVYSRAAFIQENTVVRFMMLSFDRLVSALV